MRNTLLKSVLAGGLLTLSMGAQAQTDVTSQHLQNADFSASTPITAEKIYGYGKDGSPYGLQDVEEWTTVVVQFDANNADYPNSGMGGGVVAYGSPTLLQGSGVAAPAQGPGGGEGNCLGFFGVWGCGGYYAQDVTLPAGEYTITVPIYSQSGTNATTSYTGFFPAGSETGYTVATNPAPGAWAQQTVSFSLTAETAGQIRLGYKSNGSGSGANPMIFIDGIKIEYTEVDMLPAAKEELQAEIAAAEALLADYEGYTEGIDEFTAAIGNAKLILDNATTVEQVVAAVEALKAAEKAFLDANMFSYQKYIIQNIVSEKYWGAANSWGTRASLVNDAEYVMLVPLPDGKYHLESQVSNGGTSYYFNGDYMDNGSPVKLTIKRAGLLGYSDDDETIPVYAYTIANDGKYYGWDGESTVLGKNLAADDDNALWIIASLDEATAALSEATPEDPMDATFLIEDHNFGRNNRNHDKWTYTSQKADGTANFNISGGEDGTGSIGNNCAESFHAKFEISQTLANAPAGDYELTAQGFYREDEVEGESTIDLPVFFANDATATFPVLDGEENSMSTAATSFLAGNYTIEPIRFTVTEAGKLTIGARLVESTNLWCIFDNFTLMYFGPGETVGITTLKAEKASDNAIYNMQGQRVEKAAKGIYIQNGKKMLVK